MYLLTTVLAVERSPPTTFYIESMLSLYSMNARLDPPKKQQQEKNHVRRKN
ncbi:MAG: hypothetical protein PUP93_06170 [Rhizonema sp. NSF051]|nr:hypothetical protein [Rhizonema sp. NSF051]